MRHIGIELHGVTLNVTCNYEPLLEYLCQLLDDAVRPVFDRPDLQVTGRWHSDETVLDSPAVFADDNGSTPGFGKRMRLGDDELVWFNTHRDKDLQLRFRRQGQQRQFDVAYCYHPTAEKLARYPGYAERKFFKLARYLVHFPVAWHLERTRGWTLLHASAVAREGEAVLVAGPGGAGKTTTCVGLLAQPGVRLVTENLLFTDGRHIFPLREPLRLTDDSLALLGDGRRGLVPLGLGGASKHKVLFRLPAGGDDRPVRAAALFIPRFTARGSLEPMAAADACEVLAATNRLTLELNDYDWYTAALDLLWPAPGHAAHHAEVLARLTTHTPCYGLGIDRAAGVAAVVDRVVACVGWRSPTPAGAAAAIDPIDLPSMNGARPIRCFTGEALLPDAAARQQLAEVAALSGVDGYVAVLPDVHFKRRNPTPTGTVVVSRTHLVPRAIDPGINCGMRMIATGVPVRELSAPQIDRLFGRLIAAIPITARETPVLTATDCERLLTEGLPAVAGQLGLAAEDLGRIENGGRMTPAVDAAAIQAVVAPEAVSKGLPWLGTLGAGNHFLELQEIVAEIDAPIARRLGLRLGEAVFMMHSDSRRLGKRVIRPVFEAAFQANGNGHGPDSLWTLPADSPLGGRYIAALAAAMHAGFANRAVLTHILRTAVRAVLDDPTLQLPLLYDCAHESIQCEEHGGNAVWVHRHGASHAVPPAALAHDPVLGETGQPVPIPGSMGTDSYIAVTAAGVAQTFHSVAHGAGRTLEKMIAAEQFDAGQVARDLSAGGIRLYRYGTDNIAGQAPASFKDVGRVMAAMTAFNLIRPVVRLRPVAVLKG